MPSISLDPGLSFFATPSELVGWVAVWIETHHLDSVLVKRTPGSLRWSPFDGLEESRDLDLNDFDELILETVHFDRGIQEPKQLTLQYPNRLEIDLPKMTSDSLRQATIGSVTEEPSHGRLWRSLLRDVIGKTKAGMVGINSQTRATKFYSSTRYSPGSEEVLKKGYRLHPFFGDMTFQTESQQ